MAILMQIKILLCKNKTLILQFFSYLYSNYYLYSDYKDLSFAKTDSSIKFVQGGLSKCSDEIIDIK